MPDLSHECERAVAALSYDPAGALFVGSGQPLLIWGGARDDVVWASPEAAALSLEVRGASEDQRLRLRRLADGLAPRSGFRLERLELGSASPATFAVRLVQLGSGSALLMALAPRSLGGHVERPAADRDPAPRREAPSGSLSAPRFRAGGPVRFTWRTGPEGRVEAVSAELAELVGASRADIVGLDWAQIGRRDLVAGAQEVSEAVASGSAWSGLEVLWRVEGLAHVVPVELGAMPAAPGRTPAGYRGFGIGRPDAVSLAASDGRSAADDPKTEPALAGRADAAPMPDATREDDPTPPVLSSSERGALHEIARALGARVAPEDDGAPERPSAEIVALPLARDRELARLLDRLPVGVAILRDEALIHANAALLDLAGADGLPDLVARGGLATLVGGRLEDLVSARGGTRLPLQAGARQGAWVELGLAPIGWGERPAHLATIRPVPEVELGQRVGALELEAASSGRALSDARATLDAAADGVLVVDERGRILSANGAAEQLFGHAENEVAGDLLTAVIVAEDHVVALDGLARAREGAAITEREVRGRSRGGGAVSLLMRVGRIAGRDGTLFAVAFRDGSRAKLAERTLRDAKLAAEQASAHQIEFLARVSHEIRTPLNAITGFAELMLEERFGPIGNERYKGYLRDIHGSGGHVLSLVNDLLDLAKVSSGRGELAFGSLDLNALTRQGVDITGPLAARERAILRTSLTPGLPRIMADERSIRQVVLNLLSNAIRFTGAGGQVIVSTAETEQGHVALRVRDTGPGMSGDEIEAALMPFRQVGSTRRGDGTGLGLPLSKALVEANGGSFTIGGARGTGTLVEIRLPVAATHAAKGIAAAAE